MPLYEYECDACGHRFEKIQKFSDALVKKCPNCGGPCHKLISSPAIQFKGTGWYITDYAKKDQVSSGKTDNTGPASTGSSDTKDTKDTKDNKESKDSKPSTEKTDKPAEKKTKDAKKD